jgi:hypothetical protein
MRPPPDLRNTVLALLKWVAIGESGNPQPFMRPRTDSQDAWIFTPPMKEKVVHLSGFELGRPQCDNRLAYLLVDAGYSVLNAAFAVRAVEFGHPAPDVYGTVGAVMGRGADLLLVDQFVF